MTRLRIVALALSCAVLFNSCKKDDDRRQDVREGKYQATLNFLSGKQVVPANASAGTGYFSGTYDRSTKLFTYTVSYQGLSSNVIAIHIHGIANTGYIALPAPLGPYTNGIVQSITSGFTAATSGSYTGTLTIDGVVIKESDLLNNRFYVDVHTVNYGLATTGELRAQIAFL